MAKLTGTSAANILRGKSTSDTLYGLGGNDRLEGGSGNDELEGGAGRDTFVFTSGHDEIDDFSTRDDKIIIDSKLGITSFSDLMARARVIDGGEDVRFDFGNGNTLTLEDTTLSSLKASHFSFKSIATVEPRDPLAGNDTLHGTSRADKISGGAGNDTIYGKAGNDRLSGDAGNDRLYGEAGHDELKGGAGNDYLSGGAGNDELEGGSGNDRLDGGAGNNELEGGAGRDTFVFTTGKTEIEDFTSGIDRIEIARSLGVSNFNQLKALARSADGGEDIIFDFGRSELRLEDTRISELSASDFLFV